VLARRPEEPSKPWSAAILPWWGCQVPANAAKKPPCRWNFII